MTENVMLSERERLVIAYLRPLMEANASMIGQHLWNNLPGNGSNLIALGASVCGRLRKKGLVYRLPELNAWRLTAAGRNLVKE